MSKVYGSNANEGFDKNSFLGRMNYNLCTEFNFYYLQGDQLFESYASIYNTSKFAGFNPNIPIYSFDLEDVRMSDKW